MRFKEQAGMLTNLIVIGAVLFTLVRPSGAIGAAVVSWREQRAQREVLNVAWPAISAAPRLDTSRYAVALVEFSDYECPYCRKEHESLRRVVNSPLARGLAFRHYPLAMHAHADGAARTAICAEAQGRFPAMHERLFATDAWLADSNWTREALAVGVSDTAAFRACRLSKKTTDRLAADAAYARQLRINGTPTFVYRKGVYVGAMPDTMFLRLSAGDAP